MNLARLSLIFLLVLVWGFNFVVIKVGLEGMPPVFLAFARFFLTSFPAVFFFKKPKAPFYRIALYGLVIFAMQFALFFIGMSLGVPPGLASILMQVQVFFSLLLAAFIFHEKIKPWQIVGALISFSGIAYAGTHIKGDLSFIGFLLVIAAAAFWGIGSAISKTLGKINMISLVIWGSMVAWPPLLLLSLFMEGPTQIIYCLEHLSWTSLGAVFYLTYLSTLFGYGLWSWLIHHLPLSTVAPFTLLVPVVALLSSALLLGEPIQAWKIGTSVLVIGGLCINFLASRFLRKKPKELKKDSSLLP
jgi:O-acetylserine/cysteine efflux transporter